MTAFKRNKTLCKLGFIRIARITAERRHQVVHIPRRKNHVLRFTPSVNDEAGVLPRIKTHFFQPPRPKHRYIQQQPSGLRGHVRGKRPPLILQRIHLPVLPVSFNIKTN